MNKLELSSIGRGGATHAERKDECLFAVNTTCCVISGLVVHYVLTPAVVNRKELYLNISHWYSRCHGSPGGAGGERHFIHMVHITVQTTRGDNG